MLRLGTFSLIFAAFMGAAAGTVLAAEGEPASLRVALEPAELPLSSFKSLLGQYVRSNPNIPVPDGFDSFFETRLGGENGKGGVDVRILHKGWTLDDLKLFQLGADGTPVEIPRHESRIYDYYVAFGPVRIEGLPPFTAHFYFRQANAAAMKKRPRMLYLMPMRVLTGEAVLYGRTTRIALLDTNFNGSYTDPCVQHARSGDWVLFDADGDGNFDVRYSGAESMGLTRYVKLGSETWSVALEGATLVLTPANPATYRIIFKGAGEGCTVYAWSAATGSIRAVLDGEGGIEVPFEKITLYSYQTVKHGWRINGSLRVLGSLPPPEENPLSISVGPPVKIRLDHSPRGEDHHFTFRCLGVARETVSLYKGDPSSPDARYVRAPAPVLVVRDADGEEIARQAMRYG